MLKDNQLDRPKVFLDKQSRSVNYTIQFSETNYISIIRVMRKDSALNFNITSMMMTVMVELVSETMYSIIHLKRLSAQDEVFVFCRVTIQDIYDTQLARHSRGETP
jgi:hypothetical protein